MNKVKKVIIPVAGLGTRFLPATKSLAKEMLPIVDKPIIQYLLEECKSIGIEEVLFITGKSKRSIEDHFDNNNELEDNLTNRGKLDLVRKLDTTNGLKIFYTRQPVQLGLGHAVSLAKSFVKDEPFMIFLGDELHMSYEGTYTSKKMIDLYNETGKVSVASVEVDDPSKYGIIYGTQSMERVVGNSLIGIGVVNDLVEKPKESLSDKAIIGRYLLDSRIFDELDKAVPTVGGEIQITDSILNTYVSSRDLMYIMHKGRRYDTGDKFEYLKANIELGLIHPEVSCKLRDYLLEFKKTL